MPTRKSLRLPLRMPTTRDGIFLAQLTELLSKSLHSELEKKRNEKGNQQLSPLHTALNIESGMHQKGFPFVETIYNKHNAQPEVNAITLSLRFTMLLTRMLSCWQHQNSKKDTVDTLRLHKTKRPLSQEDRVIQLLANYYGLNRAVTVNYQGIGCPPTLTIRQEYLENVQKKIGLKIEI